MKPAGRKEQPDKAGVCRVGKISWLDRCRLSVRSRGRARDLAGRLAAWNRDLWSPERILKALGLEESDLRLLKDLSGRPRGWQLFEFDPQDGAEAGRLTALGLIRLGRWRRRIRLTEAGRALLLLTEIDPKITRLSGALPK